MFKKLLCPLILLALLTLPLSVSAVSNVSFSLSDVSTEKNKLFETVLSADAEVSAFVAHLEFDENKTEFKGAKAISGSAEISVNSNEKGKVSLAYLAEDGTSGELVSFTFKSKTESTSISLSLEQVIDKNANELGVAGKKGANVTVNIKADCPKSNKTNEESNSTAHTDTGTASTGEVYIDIPSKNSTDATLIICISVLFVMIFAVAAVAFFLGRNSAENKNSRKN
ncbi:MAG: hypothetical protein IKK10_01440 [Clostridia bacterium]|nr:hypothetical protein [Clostridia bacterium]